MTTRTTTTILFSALLLLGGGCLRPSAERPVTTPEPDAPAAFGTEVTLEVDDEVEFADGLTVTLSGIDDSRCPDGAVCVWEGELGGRFLLEDGGLDERHELQLGSRLTGRATAGPYTLSLVDATRSTMTIAVTDEPAEDVGVVTHGDLLEVRSPSPDETVGSPLTIEGRARGTWFFEATFPVRMLDANGVTLGEYYAEAQGEWMTEEFVPFTADLPFDAPDTPKGVLVLEKANPSGLEEHANELRIPVAFDIGDDGGSECRRTGCGGQVCADREVMTTCEFRPEHACYVDATCERQRNGECGWTMSAELRSCLDAVLQ